MNTTQALPYWEGCPECGEHGEVVFPMSGRRYIVLSKKQAYACISAEKMHCASLPLKHVYLILIQIQGSKLPDFIEDDSGYYLLSEKESSERATLDMAVRYLTPSHLELMESMDENWLDRASQSN